MEELSGLDYRELRFWARQARKMQLLRKYDLRIAGRVAQADNEAFEEEMTKLEFQIMDIEEPED